MDKIRLDKIRFDKICMPAQIYLVLSVLSVISLVCVKRVSVGTVFLKIIFMGLWAWLLQHLCSVGQINLAWILLLLPLLLIIMIIAVVIELMAASSLIANSSIVDNSNKDLSLSSVTL
jgi:hypothetical protein